MQFHPAGRCRIQSGVDGYLTNLRLGLSSAQLKLRSSRFRAADNFIIDLAHFPEVVILRGVALNRGHPWIYVYETQFLSQKRISQE
jgi:hypothetical protein